MLNVKQESCEYQLLKSFGLTRLGNQTDYKANALTTRPRAGSRLLIVKKIVRPKDQQNSSFLNTEVCIGVGLWGSNHLSFLSKSNVSYG